MASRDAIARGLALMHEMFPSRPITAETGAAFATVFADVSDDDFLRACAQCCREPGRTFFPTSGDLAARLAPKPPLFDAESMLLAIQGMGQYNPHGWVYPSIGRIRAELGAAVAEAYGRAGHSRLFSENERTREIALRDFTEAYTGAVDADPRTALPQPDDKLLYGPMHPDLAKRLKADTGWTS